ncbi:UL16-binding protein 1-like isoform X6 [Marmota marmota marmota]|uniref:UL16-binding protein 1-like isoform X6 n=2 Tax=Marmota marmota marmota TaxID=9994 RepID=UPI0007626C21|nr:UL16-binding protein 1-like isoform X6 [Marmota marmota marmota]
MNSFSCSCDPILTAPTMTQHAQSLLLRLIVLCQAGPSLTAGLAPPLQGTHSLCYDFTINSKAAPGQQWCTVQAQVDQKNFLSFDCGMDKVKSLSALGGKVNATINWEEQKTLLRDIGNTLKQKLADIKAENDMARGAGLNTLEGRMCCQHKSNSSWQFGFNGRMWLLFDSDNRKWREIRPGSSWMKKMWENDKEVTDLLHRSSIGDCRTWIQNLKEWEAELEPTGPSTTTPDTVIEKSSASTFNHWNSVPLITRILIIGCIIIFF